jgi:signal transduction histidine kinase/phosphate/sulfate permease
MLSDTRSNRISHADTLLRTEQLGLLYGAMSASLPANLVLSAMLAAVQSQVASPHLAFGWFTLMLVALSWRVVSWRRYRRAVDSNTLDAEPQLRRFRIGALITGAVWGAAAWLLFPPNDLTHQVFLAFVIAGVTAGAATSLGEDRVSVMCFLAPSLIILAGRFLSAGGTIAFVMGFMIILFLGFITSSALRIQGRMRDNVLLRAQAEFQEHEEHRRSEMQRIVGESAAALLAAPVQEIEQVLTEVLQSSAEYLEADHAALYLFRDSTGTVEPLCEWSNRFMSGGKVGSAELLPADVAHWSRTIGDHPVLVITYASPADERIAAVSSAIRATSALRVQQQGKTVGFVRFDALHDRPNWSVEALRLLGVLGDVIGSALARREAETALLTAREEAERANSAKSEFLSSMSHELRTPMNAILGFGQLLEAESSLDEHLRDDVREILRAGRHLLDLINEVLDLAKIESGHIVMTIERVDIRSVLDECTKLIRAIADARGIRIEDSCPDGASIDVDRTRFKQALLNLMSNAVKYNCEGGVVAVRVQPADAHRLRISVSDTGHGIAPERLHELFEPFNRLGAEATSIEGTGIGLTITRTLTEMMGGTLGVESKPEGGTTFWLEFPCEAAPDTTTTALADAPLHAARQ